MCVLAEHQGRLVTDRQLLREVWRHEGAEARYQLRVHVARIRAKLERDSSRPQYLITERGAGYRLRDPAELPELLGETPGRGRQSSAARDKAMA